MACQKTHKVTVGDPSTRKSQQQVAPPDSPTTDSRKHQVHRPAHCNRCEGRPLRSQCEHTKRGREYILSQEASKNLANAIQLPVELSDTTTRNPSVEPNFESVTTFSEVCPKETIPPWVGGDIDPALLAISVLGPINPALVDPTSVSDFEAANSEAVSSLYLSNAPTSTSELSCTPASTPINKCICATANNPIYQHVDGVCRGPVPHEIHRRHPLPEPIIEGACASKTFLERMNSLVETYEDISVKTGAWLFVGASHPTATGGAINYASPRLRRDGGQRMLEFATMFLKLMKKVKEAKRLDTLEFQKLLEEQREEKERIQRELDAQRAQAAKDNRELALFRERFGSLEGGN